MLQFFEKIKECIMRKREVKQQKFEAVYIYTQGNLIEEIRVVDGYSICDGRNRLLLNRSKDVLGKSLFCVCERRIYSGL